MPSITKNKKAAEKTITIYWFAIIIIVAAAIIYMVGLVYGEPYDVRKVESEILLNHIADCISEGGYLKEKTLGDSSFKADFLKTCKLNFEAKDFPEKKIQYYVQVDFYEFDSGKKIDSISYGNLDLKQYCDLKGESLPLCKKKNLYVVSKNQKSYGVNILSIVDKADKNVR